MYNFKLTVVTLLSIFFLACKKDSSTSEISKTQGIFRVLDNQSTIEMDGVIGSSSLKHFNKLYSKYPDIKTINIKNCDGSMDDETNLKLAKKVYDLGINTHLMDNGLIASGGVDFFLAGHKRTRGTNTKMGVHSWSDGNKEAKDFPNDHAYHQPYITYYVSIGFSQQESEDFYFFTINAAPANDIHWMTEGEIIQYKMLNP